MTTKELTDPRIKMITGVARGVATKAATDATVTAVREELPKLLAPVIERIDAITKQQQENKADIRYLDKRIDEIERIHLGCPAAARHDETVRDLQNSEEEISNVRSIANRNRRDLHWQWVVIISFLLTATISTWVFLFTQAGRAFLATHIGG